jgi:hypothetical protein
LSSHPDAPDFNFDKPIEVTLLRGREYKGTEIGYDPERIANDVIWPIIDDKYRGDYRRESLPTMDEFSYPKAGTYKGRLLEVTLTAGCDEEMRKVSDGEDELDLAFMIHDATITITEHTPAMLEYVLERFKEEDASAADEYLKDDDEDPSLRSISRYRFYIDTFGGVTSRGYYALVDSEMFEVWCTDDITIEEFEGSDDEPDTDLDDEDSTVFDRMTPSTEPLYDEDIEMLLTAAAILDAPDNVVGYLQKIKKYPDVR